MADVARLPGVFEQLKLVAGLRWSLLKNSMHRKHNRWDLIGMICAGVVSGALVVGLCAAFFAGTYFFLTKGRASWIALLFWAVFLWWQVFPILIAGFGANFEFKKLLRFPLSLRAFYLLGLGYGFADFAAISSICWIVSMLAGAAAARFSIVPTLLVVCALFVLLNVTMERLFGSWMEKLMAKRRSREVFLGLFMLAMVSLNFIWPLTQRYGNTAHPRLSEYAPYLSWLPGSLAGNAVGAAAAANFRGLFISFGGLLAWMSILSFFLWRRFKAQYLGEEISESSAPQERKKKRLSGGKIAVGAEGTTAPGGSNGWIPSVSPQVAAVMAKEFHYMTRNAFSFVTFVLPPIMVVFFSMQFAGTHSPLKENALGPETFFPAVMAYLILILVSPAYNSLAFEGKGIQSYFMAPIRFRDVLLAKNIFLVTLIGLELSLTLTLLVWRIGWPTVPRFFATIGAVVFAVTGQLTLANWSSLNFPKRMEIGKMKGQRNSGVAVWTSFGVQILLGGICTAVLLAGRWFGNPWLPFEVFVGLTVATVGGYFASLDSLDRLAEKKKELLIETLCK